MCETAIASSLPAPRRRKKAGSKRDWRQVAPQHLAPQRQPEEPSRLSKAVDGLERSQQLSRLQARESTSRLLQ
eukprot:882584-Alexandrium_andersonii.AAC.1